MELNEKINLNNIIFDLYRKDSTNLVDSKEFNLSKNDKDELFSLALTDNLKSLFEGLANIFEKKLTSENFDLSLMLTLFLQRYNYFYRTEIQWVEYCKTINKINFKDPGNFFLEYIASFFEKQIDAYNDNYCDILTKYSVQLWNKHFYSKLVSLTSNIKHANNFQKKLGETEELVRFLQDTKNIYSSLEGVGLEHEKKEFLAHSNEIKIVYQSMNHLINEILKKIIKN
ncbi:hypothetical protein SHELI_v1c05750 [Spiroplasma helicoides]|uniref:Uncharacterized protein n=1 Tax=Spiroplasma helicoides TaxID=216938 RepID=A0A1B3SKS6_9MOLU|nr:hypothetical protein [Spiroplasma helicoides]AOG60526.1 hypothetical protein SHELI_v1c05750 [Spiroplasma helicoides]